MQAIGRCFSYQSLTAGYILRVRRVDLQYVAWGDIEIIPPWSWTKHRNLQMQMTYKLLHLACSAFIFLYVTNQRNTNT